MRRRWLALWVVFVLSLIAIEIAVVVLGIDPVTNFYFVIVAIAVIGILAIIGAVFVGIFLASRVMSSETFTPFEKEMLAMREDVKALTAKVDELTQALAENPREKS